MSDLVAAALGGVLSITGTPDAPLNGWGRQCFNTASLFAAICGLAGVYAARQPDAVNTLTSRSNSL